MPERCQQIGLIVYRGVSDDTLWVELRESMPEIIPRGLHGWKRIY